MTHWLLIFLDFGCCRLSSLIHPYLQLIIDNWYKQPGEGIIKTVIIMSTVIQRAFCRWQIYGHYIQLLTIKDGLTAKPPPENISPLSQEQIQNLLSSCFYFLIVVFHFLICSFKNIAQPVFQSRFKLRFWHLSGKNIGLKFGLRAAKLLQENYTW